MERTKNTNKNRLKHGLARVFLVYAFDIFFMSQFDHGANWRYLCQSGIREISPLISIRLGSLFLEPMFPVHFSETSLTAELLSPIQ